MKADINALLQEAITALKNDGILANDVNPNLIIERCRNPEHGDFACNLAMMLAKPLGKNPRDIAALIIERLPQSDNIARVDIAGPGFINFKCNEASLTAVIETVLSQGTAYGRHKVGEGHRVLMEYVSANPTGPLHVGHGRGAAYGSSLANLLKAVGYDVHREYYVNDAGRQMHILATSIWLRYLALNDINFTFPSNGYRGEYVIDIAQQLKDEYGERFIRNIDEIYSSVPADAEYDDDGKLIRGDKEKHIDALVNNAKASLGQEQYDLIFAAGLDTILADIKNDLSEFGVDYDEWFSEQALMDSDAINHCLDVLKKKKYLYEKEGALWFRSSTFGDEKDRVVIRANGQTTYFASDIAYHLNKLERGYDILINIFGADHHGYVERLKAGITAMSGRSDVLHTPLVQFVSLYRGKEKISMSTRSGSFITLRELRDEVGNDATRYFYVMRKVEQPLDFDLELAKSESSDNPVYYIQYAHARICSVWRQLEKAGLPYDKSLGLANLNLLTTDHEKALITKLLQYPEVVLNAAKNHEPHLLTHFLYELANHLHTYYNACKFIVEDERLRNVRLCLIQATQTVLKNGLTLLGLSAPEKM